MSLIHQELLDKDRKEVFEALAVFKGGAVLGGGTALSLQIAHRLSYDFDLFLSREIAQRDFRMIEDVVTIGSVNLNTPDQLNIVAKNGVRITLLYYPYASLFPVVRTGSLNLLSVKDVALDKAFTIGRRAVWRDYVDMYFLLNNYIDILEVLESAQSKFGVIFNPKLFLEQLCYFDDMEIAPISFVDSCPTAGEIKKFLVEQVKNFTDKKFLNSKRRRR